jgi:glycosyltransferase involved in cell wall biosynthesis
MESVFNQTYKSFEYIVVDGGSTDESLQVIQQFDKSTIPLFKWISEPDDGIYNAMNKGIKMSSGEFILFLNSGDIFYDNAVLEHCVQEIHKDAELCSGILILENEGRKVILNPPAELDLYQSIYHHLTHPNTFIKNTLFGKYGLYNEANKIVSDWEFFFLVSGLNECNYQSLDINIAVFYENGISSNDNELQEQEKENILRSHLTPMVRKELRQRWLLENSLNETWYVQMIRLKRKPFLYKIAVNTIKVLNKLSQ